MRGEEKTPNNGPIERPRTYRETTRIYKHGEDQAVKKKPRSPHKIRKSRLVISLIIIVLLGLTIYSLTTSSNTLPLPISKQVVSTLGFDIYYPNQKKLPSGYILNKSSFSYSDQTIIYTVTYGKNQKIVFSVQAKPSNANLQAFYAKNIPLHTTQSTPSGQATLGAINSQTFVSLPTKTNAWLIITAPGNINQTDLAKVLNSIELAK